MDKYQGYCCEMCFSDDMIHTFIQEHGQSGDCPYCKSKKVKVCDTEQVGDFIKAGLRRAYEEVDYLLVKEGLCHPLSIHEILTEELCIFSERLLSLDETYIILLEDMMDSQLSLRDIKHGGDKDLEFQDIFGNNFMQRTIFPSDLSDMGEIKMRSTWDRFKYICQHYNRFFDMSSKPTREHLLKVLENIWQQVEKRVYKAQLHRIRIYNLSGENIRADLEEMDQYQEIGPAPYMTVKQNRMSPAGIPYIYLSNSFKTCAKETHISDGQTALWGKFTLKKPLLLLDLTVESIQKQNFDTGSIFSEEYNPDMLWIKDFLLRFAHEISKPVLEETANLDYVPTQLMAEYIRKSGYQGIVFSSSVNPTGYNYVLFYGPTTKPTHEGFDYFNFLPPYTDVLQLEELVYGKVTLTPSIETYSTALDVTQLEIDRVPVLT
jgi:hypothetical protein